MVPLLFAKYILDYFAKNTKGVAMTLAVLLWLVGIIQNCVISVASTFTDLLGAIDGDSLNSFKGINFSQVPYIGAINAFLPLSEFVGMMTIYCTAWGLVIVFRWVKSLVPTLAN